MNPVIYTPVGGVKICTLWDFMAEVKRRRLHSDVARELAMMKREEFNFRPYRYTSDVEDSVISSSIHTLKQTPVKILKELKSTCSKIDLYGKELNFREVLEDSVVESMHNFGVPTHLFSIGKGRYALLCKDDVELYVNESYEQILVCHAKKRNFIIYAPHMKLEIR